MDQFLTSLGPAKALTNFEILFSLCMSFVLGMVIAAVYRFTHQGFTYARSFIHTIVLAPIVITIMVIGIGNNMARGLGIMGALAFIRFRTPIRDPRDIIFLFASLAVGISCGAQVFAVAIIGSLFFGFAAFFLKWSPFASRRDFEGLLRFLLPPKSPSMKQFDEICTRYTSSVELVAMREAIQGEVLEYSYTVRLLDPSYKTDLVDAVNKMPGVSEVSLVMQRTTVEI